MALIDTIKMSCRIDGTEADADYQGFIDACKEDLKRVGWDASKVIDTDIRVIEACKLYVKWRIDFQGKGELYGANYREYRDGTSLNEDYNGGVT